MIDWLLSIEPEDWCLIAIGAVLMTVTIVEALRPALADPDVDLLETHSDELLAAQVHDLDQSAGDVLLVNVRRPQDAVATPVMVDSAQLSLPLLTAAHRAGAMVVLQVSAGPRRRRA